MKKDKLTKKIIRTKENLYIFCLHSLNLLELHTLGVTCLLESKHNYVFTEWYLFTVLHKHNSFIPLHVLVF